METETIWGQLPGQVSPNVRGARQIKRGEPVPEGWVIVKQGTIYDHIKPVSELAGIKGGVKELWLRQNRKEIIEYFERNGEVATRNRYILKSQTLEALLSNGRRKPFIPPFSKVDKLELRVEQYRCDAQDLRREIAELKEQFGNFQQTVSGQIAKGFLLPWLQHGIKLDTTFNMKPTPDILNLVGFNPKKPQRHSNKRGKHLQPV